MYSMYAADPRARINLGIRRRLAPLLENDRDRIKLMNSLLLSMPGSPVLYYGDEIGMGDNIFLGDRDGVRTPMQWTSDRNGGFSRADPQALYLPPIQDPVYGFEAVNVEAQSRDASSLLNWTRRMLAIRQSTQVFGRGSITLLHPGNRKVLAYLRELGDEVVLCVANLSRAAQPVELDLARHKLRVPVEMGGHIAFPPIGDVPYLLTLPAYGFYWFRLATDVEPPAWHTDRRPVEDLAVLVLFDGWNSLFRDRVVPWRISLATKTLQQFETALLPRFLARQRWFVGSGQPPERARIADHAVLALGDREWLLTLLDTPGAQAAQHCFAPFALAWEDGDDDRLRQLGAAALAKVRMQARVGVLADALFDEAFCGALVQAIGAGRELPMAKGLLRFKPSRDFQAIAGRGQAGPTGPLQVQQQARNTTVQLGERLFLKVMRQVQPGLSVEHELGRFLSEVAHFDHCAPLAGSVEHVAADGTVSTLALLHAWIPNQGHAWNLAVEHLVRQLERLLHAGAAGAADAPADAAVDGGFLAAAQRLAARTAELHAALARPGSDAAFAPEPLRAADLPPWAAQARARAAATLAVPQAHQAEGPIVQLALAQRVAQAAGRIDAALLRAAAAPASGLKCRIHGALRLQELVLANNDFVLVDFEGDLSRPIAERRHKQSPLHDVASLLHSFTLARLAALQVGAHPEAEQARREALARSWGAAVRQAFLQAYAQAATASGLWPTSSDFNAALPLLQAFELDQALQHLGCELQRHPPVPAASSAALSALLELIDTTDMTDTTDTTATTGPADPAATPR